MAALALVTGAHGFLGRHVARLLHERGWEVFGYGHGDWRDDNPADWGISIWQHGNVSLDRLVDLRIKPSLVVHCAGSGSVGYSMAEPFLDFQRSVETTLSALEYTRTQAPNAKLVLPSSAAVYGQVDTVPISESIPLRPISPYGLHKKMSEELCCSYAQHFGLETAVVRFFSLYGPGLRKQLLWDSCQKILRNDTCFSGTGEELRDWLHVEDAAELVIAAALHASPACPVLNGGTGDGTRVRDFLGEVFSGFGRDDQPQFTGEVRATDPTVLVPDVTRSQNLGWTPKVQLRDGIRQYIKWFRKEVSNEKGWIRS